MTERYGNLHGFLEKFNPDVQHELCADKQECYFGDYPTLALVQTAYGTNAAVAWLVAQINNISEYTGVKSKLSQRQMEDCARIIAEEFFYLKISEMMLFFRYFKSGKYGKFYGSVDPLVITTSLRDFMVERTGVLDRHEREENARRIEESMKDAITWEEYCRRHGIENTGSPLEALRNRP